MYLHLGNEVIVKTDDIIGIFDMDNTSVSKATKDYLKQAQISNNVINVSYEIPKSYIVCEQNGKTIVYISQISSQTLLKRADTKNGRIKKIGDDLLYI